MTRDIYYAKYYGKEGAGGGKCLLGRKLRIREKNEKGERKTTQEDYIKNGGNGLKYASFWVINSQTFADDNLCNPFYTFNK